MLKIVATAVVLGLASAGAVLHLTLVDSFPREDAVLNERPREILLKFNERPDSTRRGISLRGPEGAVKLGAVRSTDDTLAFAAAVEGPMGAGQYTVSWLAAAPDHAAIRGRFRFTLQAR